MENEKYEYLETVRDRVISSEFLTQRIVQVCPMQGGKISTFATFGSHLGFLRKMKKNMNISKTVQDKAILREFLTQRVVRDCPMQRGKISIFATFGGHLGF